MLPLLLDKIAACAIDMPGIRVFVAHGQCDALLAGLAKRHDAIVHSEDADYAVFPLEVHVPAACFYLGAVRSDALYSAVVRTLNSATGAVFAADVSAAYVRQWRQERTWVASHM